jgi:hypothetical protein
MKGGAIKKLTELRIPAFLGALLDILPKCIEVKEENRELTRGFYDRHLAEVIVR